MLRIAYGVQITTCASTSRQNDDRNPIRLTNWRNATPVMMPGSVSGLISTPSISALPGIAFAHERQRRQHAQHDGRHRRGDRNLAG